MYPVLGESSKLRHLDQKMRIDWLYKLYLFENNDNNEVFLIIYKLFNFISRSLRRYRS
jgi:hypothetical protein